MLVRISLISWTLVDKCAVLPSLAKAVSMVHMANLSFIEQRVVKGLILGMCVLAAVTVSASRRVCEAFVSGGVYILAWDVAVIEEVQISALVEWGMIAMTRLDAAPWSYAP